MAKSATVDVLNEARYKVGELYRCHAYVCSAACVRRLETPPTSSFAQIYQHRPAECRYAVAGQWVLHLGKDRFIVWDLFNVLKNAATGQVTVPKPRLVHDDLDAAIMATVLLYNKEK